MARSPHEPQLRLVPRHPRHEVAAARKAVADRAIRPAPRPPEGIAPSRELARHARAGLVGAVRVARWADDVERPWLRAPRADWDRARLAGLVEMRGERARPSWRLRAWDRDDRAVLRGWVALFDAWSLAHPAPEPVADEAMAVADVIQAMPQVLALLHLTGGPVREQTLLHLLGQRVEELLTERCELPYGADGAPLPGAPEPAKEAKEAKEVTGAKGARETRGPRKATEGNEAAAAATARDAAARETIATQTAKQPTANEVTAAPPRAPGRLLPGLLDWALDAFVSVGALTRDGERDEAMLTPLGHWAVWVKIEQICVAAQGPEGHIEQPAEAMLRSSAGLSPRAARAEYRAWLAARPTGSAVAELLAVARGDDALLRGLAFEALRAVGAAAETAVRTACDEPMLRPYALLWLAEQEGADPEDALAVLTRQEATWLWVDTAAAVADHGEGRLLVRHLESAVQGSVPALLAEVRAAGHPGTVQVLVALAAVHPDPAVAKAVRRAAFQVHTGGG